MKTLLCTLVISLAISGGLAQAEVIGFGDIIAAPASVIDDAPGAENDHQQAFTESTSVTLPSDVAVDGGTIAAGTVVDSHMIFLNTPDSGLTFDEQNWSFDGPIIGVMSDQPGALEVASSGILGSTTTIYPAAPFGARGLETGPNNFFKDSYTFNGSSINVRMFVIEPGDWIRVVTLAHFNGTILIQPLQNPNSINLGRKGVLPIGLISTDELNALDVDIDSVEFGDPTLTATVKPLRSAVEDINGDGVDDVIFHFSMKEIVAEGALDADSVEGLLTGTTTAGNPFSALDSVRIVPPKKKK